MISKTSVIYPNVKLGKNVTIEDFCIIGCPFKGSNNEKTVIGDNSLIRSHTVIYAGNKIGSGFQTGHKANIRELNTIGNNVSIGTLSIIEHHVQIEDNVRIHSQVFVPEFTILKKGSWLGPNVVLTNAKYPLSQNVKNELKGPVIKESAKIGANVTILPGIIIGEKSLVGAGSVVVKDVEDYTIVAGNPAKFIRKVHY
ncbi:MAG: transferase [Spirochaetes bacterium]|nr:transferase [Spirochaetota bacterium]